MIAVDVVIILLATIALVIVTINTGKDVERQKINAVKTDLEES